VTGNEVAKVIRPLAPLLTVTDGRAKCSSPTTNCSA
jgi:hypothetical protein